MSASLLVDGVDVAAGTAGASICVAATSLSAVSVEARASFGAGAASPGGSAAPGAAAGADPAVATAAGAGPWYDHDQIGRASWSYQFMV